MSEKLGFAAGDFVVYPTHGVGKILGIEMQEIAGYTLNVFVVHFDKDRMTLRVPLAKAKGSGLRRLSTRKEMDAALAKLKGRSRAKRTMWSRRAQEYEQKINSGDPASIAEVVRDLYRNVGQPEQSYSERQIYQAALDRLVREFAAVEKIDEDTATRLSLGRCRVWPRPPLAIRTSLPACAGHAASGRWARSTARGRGSPRSTARSPHVSPRATASSISAAISAMGPTSPARLTSWWHSAACSSRGGTPFPATSPSCAAGRKRSGRSCSSCNSHPTRAKCCNGCWITASAPRSRPTVPSCAKGSRRRATARWR